MNDLTTILMILSKSKETFSKRALHNNSGFIVKFDTKDIEINFDKDGNFDYILNGGRNE